MHGKYGVRETPATTGQTVLASLLATTDQAETVTGTTSKTPTTAETKEKTTTKAAEQQEAANEEAAIEAAKKAEQEALEKAEFDAYVAEQKAREDVERMHPKGEDHRGERQRHVGWPNSALEEQRARDMCECGIRNGEVL